ncbi:MAG: CPBP family intramembrane metalloprotease [Bacteroidetes bacterium]|nr:CPBP family intramembrane metalloprotease [Bacteroidota bacterium]
MFEYLLKTKTFFLFVGILIIQIILALIPNFFDVDFGENSMENKSLLHIFFLVVIFAPILETMFFNVLPVELLNSFIKNKYLIILLASIVFALIHTYSVAYLIMTYFGSIGLNAFYLVVKEKKGLLMASGLTILLHSIYNLIGFLLIEIFHVL